MVHCGFLSAWTLREVIESYLKWFEIGILVQVFWNYVHSSSINTSQGYPLNHSFLDPYSLPFDSMVILQTKNKWMDEKSSPLIRRKAVKCPLPFVLCSLGLKDGTWGIPDREKTLTKEEKKGCMENRIIIPIVARKMIKNIWKLVERNIHIWKLPLKCSIASGYIQPKQTFPGHWKNKNKMQWALINLLSGGIYQ